jgi:hypothetical protein
MKMRFLVFVFCKYFLVGIVCCPTFLSSVQDRLNHRFKVVRWFFVTKIKASLKLEPFILTEH